MKLVIVFTAIFVSTATHAEGSVVVHNNHELTRTQEQANIENNPVLLQYQFTEDSKVVAVSPEAK